MKLGINSEWAEITKLSLLDFNGKRKRTLPTLLFTVLLVNEEMDVWVTEQEHN